jgi:hypothetical protein
VFGATLNRRSKCSRARRSETSLASGSRLTARCSGRRLRAAAERVIVSQTGPMSEYISSFGKTAEEIRRVAFRSEPGTVWARFTVKDFQRLTDMNGHVVRLELPGQVCSFLRRSGGCECAEVLRTPHLADAVVVATFRDERALEDAATALASHVFQLQHFRLPCPPLDVTRKPLQELLSSDTAG